VAAAGVAVGAAAAPPANAWGKKPEAPSAAMKEVTESRAEARAGAGAAGVKESKAAAGATGVKGSAAGAYTRPHFGST